jgi:CubicO group peptidase (beta-lactamase class C family)
MRTLCIPSFLLLLLLAIGAFGQTSLEKKVDNVVRTLMEKQKVPGVSVAVVKDGKPVIVKGYGLANVEHKVPVKPESIFQSGSIGKQFTAFAVMLLVDEGKIKLDEKIGTYLGDVPESWSNITVRQLLTHTGGLGDYPDDFDIRKDYTEEELLEVFKKLPTEFAPGERWMYSNVGYVTLGVIIRKASGKFYGDFLKERVFGPLGMETARVISEADIIPNRAAGYRLVKDELKNQEWVAPSLNTSADGSLYVSVLDMIKWDRALRERKLLSEDSYKEMWTPVKLNSGRTYGYGFGWGIGKVNGHRIIEHGGAWQGFKSFISRYPDVGLTVIVFCNLQQMNPGRMAHLIAEELEPALVPKTISQSDGGDLGAICRIYNEIMSGKLDNELFTSELQVDINGDRKGFLMWLKERSGTAGQFLLMDQQETKWGREFRVRAVHDSDVFLITAVIDKDGKFSVFDIDWD